MNLNWVWFESNKYLGSAYLKLYGNINEKHGFAKSKESIKCEKEKAEGSEQKRLPSKL